MKFAIAIFVLILSFGSAVASDSRYGSWKQPGNDQSELLKELEQLITEAERARAADPRFLRDLRALVRRHSNPWPVALIFDDFRDGDYTANPAWKVGSGYFQVLRGGGLRSGSDYRTQQQPQQSSRKERDRDVAVRILNQILTGGSGQQGGQADSSQGPTGGPAEIYLPQTISNAFSLDALIAGGGDSGFELGVYQGPDRQAGYRLIYTPKDGLLLLRLSQRGTSVIDRTQPEVNLLDGKDRTLAWQRDLDGAMTVSVDDRKLLVATDRGFREPFDGLHLFNRGGEFTLYSVAVDGVR